MDGHKWAAVAGTGTVTSVATGRGYVEHGCGGGKVKPSEDWLFPSAGGNSTKYTP